MSRTIAVLRPEPGNAATAAAIEARGARALRLPLFAVQAVAWDAPRAGDFDALILTSANAVRHAGPGLAGLAALPVHAVGAATARAARDAGLTVVATGEAGAEALLEQAEAAGVRRALHLAGRERSVAVGGIVAAMRTVYASDAIPIDAAGAWALAGTVALVQSARAGARLGEWVDAGGVARGDIAIVAVGARAAEAAGAGWARVAIAASPALPDLIDAAIALAD
ncbi:uroporphyrinogen-III synthase [Sphingomonas hengshuiensis]|uniref:Uroporphyrinogen-III synthase n=1 Tax=Sphingomonas hengshuiensis TaxID=1609977 RepID=A0A7U4JB98_9SPHN|nr:uroporphyrinogen-III synthase [Sphingomonas hengshuiensis]AJP73646.1 uroporphyrinogen-III synthase [Sphingomonas hengshuiensis]